MGKALAFIGQLAILALVSFGLHFLLQSITKHLPLWDSAYMQLWQIYALQFLLSALLIFAVVGIGKSMPQNLGFLFLGFLTLKLVINYFAISSALKTSAADDFFKYNFLGVFFLFMFFDVYVTYRVLNQSHSSENK